MIYKALQENVKGMFKPGRKVAVEGVTQDNKPGLLVFICFQQLESRLSKTSNPD